MRTIVTALLAVGLMGCNADVARGFLAFGAGGGGLAGPELKGNDPERMCEGATPGRARHECLAAHGVDDSQPTEQDRRNAETRATGARLERERAEAAKCVVPPTAAREAPSAAHLDRELAARGIGTVTPRLRGCRHSSDPGEVVVNISVAARGCVVAVAIESASDPDLGTCVATALGYATFAATETGGAFRYPYKF